MKLKKIYLAILSLALASFSCKSKTDPDPLLPGDSEAWFFQATGDNATGKTVVILPGGGYGGHAIDHEGFDWVPFFNDLGINVAVLKYKLPDGNFEIPLNDVKATIESLQKNAGQYHINPADIGVMGFSAGGHLASAYSTHAEGAVRPAFQILFYPVVSLKSELTHQGSRDSFLGADQSEERVKMFSGEEQVTASTPPAIIFHSHDDDLVVPDNSILYYQALRRAGVPASLHIYPVGGHGWGFRDKFPYHDVMLRELAAWLTR